jgi:glycosyltransferase involved in cell wall biosynthesis
MSLKRILITSPSLNAAENVSGISSITADIIQASKYNLLHFRLGSRDGMKRNTRWVFVQLSIYFRLIKTALSEPFQIVHLNLGLEELSIVRDSVVFFILKRIFRKKILLHVHGGYYLIHEPRKRYLKYLMKRIFLNADSIIVLSSLEKEILSKRYGTLSFHVFPNAVNTGLLQDNRQSDKKDIIDLVFMGRINESKGIFTISDSMKYLQPYFHKLRLTIYGTGPSQDQWLDDLKQYPGLEFSYGGITTGTEKWKILSRSDVFLLPALHSEGMPIAMIEAMAAGCTVIVTDVASIRTVVADNQTGILLSESSPAILAKKIIEIIEKKIDPKAIGRNAKEYVRKNLALSAYVSRLEQLYSTL